MTRALGIDVGGTKIAAGLLELPTGKILTRRVIPTQPARSGREVLNDVLSLARELNEQAQVAAIGLGICELVDRTGRIVSDNCVKWTRLDPAAELKKIASAVIEADVRAGALAEAILGAGRPFRNFLYVTIGTGISCCLMLHGQPYLGAHGATGTMASSPLSLPCDTCGQINHRTLEQIASGPALVERYRQSGSRADRAQDVLAANTDSARQIITSAANALGSQIGMLINVLDPEAVILGGGLGLSNAFSVQLPPSIRQHIWSGVHRDLPILPATTAADAGWIGAALKAATHCVS